MRVPNYQVSLHTILQDKLPPTLHRGVLNPTKTPSYKPSTIPFSRLPARSLACLLSTHLGPSWPTCAPTIIPAPRCFRSRPGQAGPAQANVLGEYLAELAWRAQCSAVRCGAVQRRRMYQ